MKKNIGAADRVIRIILGLFILSLMFWGPKSLWGLLGLLPLLTAVISWCPAYVPFGITTCKRKQAEGQG
ncbi:MAG: DUF2892 domain-containing protein [candidate division Zixibacteria bacterium]|nr:DUF2892 domain-containing protein [candidate division Zixibacteria bacterium]